MSYDTTIKTVIRTERVTTKHTDEIDWTYDFFATEHTNCMGTDAAGKAERIREQMERLKICEAVNRGETVDASNYGGWPRIWQEVVGVGMLSQWPYWKPRPCVQVNGTLGYEWFDWMSLTGAEVRKKEKP
jgi:hypothetical protein